MAPSTITEDYYLILEVEPSATTDSIVKSYRRLALKLHPDRNSKDDATKTFQLLGQAYKTLKDESKRRAYDVIYPSIKRASSAEKSANDEATERERQKKEFREAMERKKAEVERRVRENREKVERERQTKESREGMEKSRAEMLQRMKEAREKVEREQEKYQQLKEAHDKREREREENEKVERQRKVKESRAQLKRERMEEQRWERSSYHSKDFNCYHQGWWNKVHRYTDCPECGDFRAYLLQCPFCDIQACPKCQRTLRDENPRW